MAKIEVLEEVPTKAETGEWTLCFQWGVWHYDDSSSQDGYRFIWRDKENKLRPQRGQARIPDAARMLDLMGQAADEGWFVTAE